MHMFRKNLSLISKATFYSFLIISMMAFVGCSSSSSGDGDDDGDKQSNDDGDASEFPALASLCGSILDGSLFNPAPGSSVEIVDVDAITPDMVAVTRREGIEAGNTQLVVLHGVTDANARSFELDRGRDFINSETAGGAFLVSATDAEGNTCAAVGDGGGQGIFGQLFTLSGGNISEALISQGILQPAVNGCFSEQLVGCYAGIDVVQEFSSQFIRDFIWKPSSERDGGLVVLVDPFGVTIVVRGARNETLTDFGASNGRGTTARSSASGCAFGSATVTFFDSEGRQMRISDGRESVSIPNGCDRVEFLLP